MKKTAYSINAQTRTTAALSVKLAATVICVRLRPDTEEMRYKTEGVDTLDKWECMGIPKAGSSSMDSREDADGRVAVLFGHRDKRSFKSPWQVLMAQSEVVNWMRSTQEKPATMRYAGEWKFAGGSVDEGETLLEAAKRELQEEFCFDLPPESEKGEAVALKPFSVSQTRPIKNTSYLMHSFLAVGHGNDNTWLSELNVDSLNQSLQARRESHKIALNNGVFWSMSDAEKAEISPEVRRIEWLDLSTAVRHAFSSMNRDLAPVNTFQEQEFRKHQIERRDPMFITMVQLLQLEDFNSKESLLEFTESVAFDHERQSAKWLEDGMSPDQVNLAFTRRVKARQGKNKL